MGVPEKLSFVRKMFVLKPHSHPIKALQRLDTKTNSLFEQDLYSLLVLERSVVLVCVLRVCRTNVRNHSQSH